jgi:ATP-binding cassette subfamily B protein
MAGIERFEDEGTKKIDPRLTLRLLSYLRPYRLRATASVLLVILSSFAEIAGPVIIAVAVDLFVLNSPGEGNAVSNWVGNVLAAKGWTVDPLEGVTWAAGIYLVTLIVGFVVLYTQMVLMNMMGQYIMFDLRKQIFGHLQKLHVQYFDRNPVGRLITRVTTDVDALNEMFTAGFVSIFGDVFVLVGIIGMLFWLNWKLALVLFSVIPFLVIVSIWFRSGARKTYRMVRARIAAINAFLQEHITGMPVVQLFNRQEEEGRRFERLNAKHRDANIESIYYYSVFYPIVEIVQSVGIALIVWYGGASVLEGTLTIGALIAFFQYAQRFYEPISDLSEKYNILQAAMAASERIFKLLDTEVKIVDEGTIESVGELNEIEFRDVWFAYNDEDWVLKGVSFRVERGDRVALVGHTGAGKTTVTNLLLRFYEAQKGEILVNGRPLRDYRIDALRKLFAIVQQDVFLFSGSVADNISLASESITREKIQAAARRVHAERFIERLDKGYDAPVRERGAGFAVGEKQLLSFARALAFNPPVLVLDEATSSIDSETERLIQDAIEVLMEGRTTIAIAHRLSTIRSADQILVFHHGEIRERGTHDELVQLDGIYRRLYELQYREEVGFEESASA